MRLGVLIQDCGIFFLLVSAFVTFKKMFFSNYKIQFSCKLWTFTVTFMLSYLTLKFILLLEMKYLSLYLVTGFCLNM